MGTRTMPTLTVIKHFDVIKNIAACAIAYADVQNMDMHDLSVFFSFSPQIRKIPVPEHGDYLRIFWDKIKKCAIILIV